MTVESVVQEDSKLLVTLEFSNDFDKRYYHLKYQPIVTVENQAGKWMITKIEWIENK